jgi:hypothetical protein
MEAQWDGLAVVSGFAISARRIASMAEYEDGFCDEARREMNKMTEPLKISFGADRIAILHEDDLNQLRAEVWNAAVEACAKMLVARCMEKMNAPFCCSHCDYAAVAVREMKDKYPGTNPPAVQPTEPLAPPSEWETTLRAVLTAKEVRPAAIEAAIETVRSFQARQAAASQPPAEVWNAPKPDKGCCVRCNAPRESTIHDTTNKNTEIRMASHAFVPFDESSELLCPVHKNLDAEGKLKPFDNCIACIRNERDELRLAHPERKEEQCGTAESAGTSTNADTRPIAMGALPSEELLLEWRSLSKESQEKVTKWFNLAAEHLQNILEGVPERKEADEPWLYAIAEPSGAWHDGESCVYGDLESAQEDVDQENESLDEAEPKYSVVPLYRKPVLAGKEADEVWKDAVETCAKIAECHREQKQPYEAYFSREEISASGTAAEAIRDDIRALRRTNPPAAKEGKE